MAVVVEVLAGVDSMVAAASGAGWRFRRWRISRRWLWRRGINGGGSAAVAASAAEVLTQADLVAANHVEALAGGRFGGGDFGGGGARGGEGGLVAGAVSSVVAVSLAVAIRGEFGGGDFHGGAPSRDQLNSFLGLPTDSGFSAQATNRCATQAAHVDSRPPTMAPPLAALCIRRSLPRSQRHNDRARLRR